MDKEFVPYEQALALKELGFDEPCIGFFKEYKGSLYVAAVDQHWGSSLTGISKTLGYRIDDLVLAPTFSQAFRWFRDIHKLHGWISPRTEITGRTVYIPHGRTIPDTLKDNFIVDIISYSVSPTAEEAELDCLKKLIEIIQSR